jgi:hypothetical protein
MVKVSDHDSSPGAAEIDIEVEFIAISERIESRTLCSRHTPATS